LPEEPWLFSVIFGFVAANALWSQPGQHPAPILKTREVAAPTAPAASALPKTTAPFIKDVPARTVTTFRIERGDDTATASIPIPNATPTQVPVPTPKTAAEPAVKADPVLIRIQQVLAAKGLYTGEIDGLMGPKSEAAIRTWEKANGYTQTGKATAACLR
jgi:peptidoglycan hydrolase-like protein with peptidoglycan-binding domain